MLLIRLRSPTFFLSAYPPLYGTMLFSVGIVTELKHVLLNIQLFNQAGGGEWSFEALSVLSNPYAVSRKNPENNQSQSAQKKSSAR